MGLALDLYPKRIVCLTEETTETLYLLGEQERIVGISGFTVRPPQARKEKPKVSVYLSADIPKLQALEPDLILAFSDLQADIVRDLTKLGYDVMVFNQRSVQEILRAVVTIGSLVGKQRQAEQLAGELARGVDEARERGRALPVRPRVFFEEWPHPLITGIRWVSELIEVAGGENVCSEASQQPLASGRVMDPAAVAARDPQLVLASWCGKMVKPERIRQRPGWEQVSAVRANRIYEIKSPLILQPGPAALTDGLAEIERRVHRAARELAAEGGGSVAEERV